MFSLRSILRRELIKEGLEHIVDYASRDKSQDALEKSREVLKKMNALAFTKTIAKDFYRNLTEADPVDTRKEFLQPSDFILFISNAHLPKSFKVKHEKKAVNYKIDVRKFLTKVGEADNVMRIRVLDGKKNTFGNVLFLLVNPSSLQFSQEKSFSEYTTRTGPKSEFWGNKPIELSLEGSSGGFFKPYIENEEKKTGHGYWPINFMDTLAFQNILSLVTFYKNNGFSLGKSSVQSTKKDRSSESQGNKGAQKNSVNVAPSEISYDVNRVDLVEIAYRDTVYWGSFSGMSLTYSSSSPGRMTYSFNFTAYRHMRV